MKRKKSPWNAVISCLSFFPMVAFIITVAILVYILIDTQSGGNKAQIAGAMLGVVIGLSLFYALADFLRRKYTVERTVDKILGATDKIAMGDFSVRLETAHGIGRYDNFDYICENLNKMAAELARTEVLHTDFVSNVSHEMKTPLAVIQNYATSLKDKDLDEEKRIKYADAVAAAARRLTTLVTNVLKLNKLENQSLTPPRERIAVSELLAETVLGYEEIIDGKGLALECNFEEVTAYSSRAYLEVVFNNLVSNAVKFTAEGGKISLSLAGEGDKFRFTITDTGCGMSDEVGRHIFEKFYQGDTSHSTEGNGLGLALVKKVIDVLGGEIEVLSKEGEGTTFVVRLDRGNEESD